jgi:hypothetical protein
MYTRKNRLNFASIQEKFSNGEAFESLGPKDRREENHVPPVQQEHKKTNTVITHSGIQAATGFKAF